jgi:hypothetical protein
MANAECWAVLLPVRLTVHCASCEGLVELECEGLGGTTMYATYNEFACPHCLKQNHALTAGHILSTGALV